MPPPLTLRSFASFTASIAASHAVGGFVEHACHEAGVEEGGRGGEEDSPLHESRRTRSTVTDLTKA
jgi:hypothetical protein